MILKKHKELLTYLPDMYAAAQRSRVTRKKMGSIIVGHLKGRVWQILSDGCNGVASGEDHVFEKNGETLSTVIHAEENALNKLKNLTELKALDLSVYKKLVIFVMSSPCPNCAKRIVNFGSITDVIYVDDYRDQSALDYLRQNGIGVDQVNERQCFDLIRNINSVKGSLISSYLQKELTKVLIAEAHLPDDDENPFYAYRREEFYSQIYSVANIERIQDSFNLKLDSYAKEENLIVYDFKKLFNSHCITLDVDFIAAFRYMLLSIAGVLGKSYKIHNLKNLDREILLNQIALSMAPDHTALLLDNIFNIETNDCRLHVGICYKNILVPQGLKLDPNILLVLKRDFK
jgi:deoxycytidylate deaminase